jgi:HK97 family phage major capsid protein
MELIKKLMEQRAKLQADLDAILEKADTEQRTALTEEELATFNQTDTDLKALDERIAQLKSVEDRRAAAAAVIAEAGPVVKVRSEPLTYSRARPELSYFLDLARVTALRDVDAAARLQRHQQEMDVELVARNDRREHDAEQEMRSLPEGSGFERRVNPNRTDGQGGYFVPPLWLIDEYATLARAGRVFANSIRNMTLPSGTDSINVPKIATGTTTAAQTADAAGVSSTDLTDTVATAAVKTIAGQQDIAMQLLEQSPISFDEVVLADLLADYNMKLDQQLLVGSNASGQVQGINGLSGTNGITYTQASPTGPLTYAPIAQGISQVASNRYLPPTAIFMHPRRWFWLAAALDTANRPLVVPVGNGPYNPEALQTGMAAEGPVGQMLGIPVLIDPNVPVLQGAGTEDRIYVVRTPDLILWEGNLRSRVLQEVLSGTLQVRVQLYNYFAFMPDRYPKSISVISGTGLIAPSGF